VPNISYKTPGKFLPKITARAVLEFYNMASVTNQIWLKIASLNFSWQRLKCTAASGIRRSEIVTLEKSNQWQQLV
jgi:hypothetical protein